jgi:hypothetical protein
MKRSTDCMSIANREQADFQVSREMMERTQGGYRIYSIGYRDSLLPRKPSDAQIARGWGAVMSIAVVRKALLWCAVINYGVLIMWWLFFLFTHDWMHGLHSRWFHLSVEQFDALHYTGMALYKVGILLLNLVPYIALRIVGRAETN